MMTIKVDDECRIVVGTIIWAIAGGAIVFSPMAHRRLVECVNRLLTGCREGNVRTLAYCNCVWPELECKLIAAIGQAVTHSLIGLPGSQIAPDADIAERRKHRIIEFRGPCDVSDSERDVMKHVHGKSAHGKAAKNKSMDLARDLTTGGAVLRAAKVCDSNHLA